ncbi:carboxypeptidase-like regulatory domain-containing protein [Streptomyces sp. NPDC006668]|uniref:carboxypeptidase-like regulatory domain-containing protein n=1 Tax=Streptomyces sp. NPDC006668 TaxID=3156903 RepID=UPI00340F00CB
MPTLTIQVYLAPTHDAEDPDPKTWPKPHNVTLELSRTTGGPPITVGPSDERGLITCELEPGTYTVAARPDTAVGFTDVRASGNGEPTDLVLAARSGQRGKEPYVVLLPEVGTRLVRLRTVTQEGETAPGARASVAGVDYVSGPDGLIHATAKGESVDVVARRGGFYAPLDPKATEHPMGVDPLSDEPKRLLYRLDCARFVIEAEVDGEPVVGAVFRLVPSDARDETDARRQPTDRRGRCVFDTVDPGMVDIAVDDLSHAKCGTHGVDVDPRYRRALCKATRGKEHDISERFRFLRLATEETYGISGQVRDEDGHPVPNVRVTIHSEDGTEQLGTTHTDDDGDYELVVDRAGVYLLSADPGHGEPVQWTTVDVNSTPVVPFVVTRPPGRGGGTTPSGQVLSDLSSFPVLTEDIGSGRGAPVVGGDRSATYGQIVEGALRDVLGWRPGSNTSGFQAALTGAFELREVEGHTEFTWHPRGCAVQADLGALTGAQASIYNRAKNALDQVTPLLDGLQPLDPAADPQDTEAIRTIVRSELGELVDELAVEGGPRIQRVDELFTLLAGRHVTGTPLDPDSVGGQLAQLRERFGLNTGRVGTLDEERIVTNFRIVVDHVLALEAGWRDYRRLFDGTTPDTSLGTVLIRLSRNLDVVAQSVEEDVFTLESVFIDAAQRQTIRLEFPASSGLPSILFSDLLDWVVRVSTSEAPRLIREAGKDGVVAITPILDQLADLVRRTLALARSGTLPSGVPLPDGLRTGRVVRALGELAQQLTDTATLAHAVQRGEPPLVVFAEAEKHSGHHLRVRLVGSGFLPGATAELSALERPDWAVIVSHGTVDTTNPGRAIALFHRVPRDSGLTWVVTLVNPGGIRSNTVDALTT